MPLLLPLPESTIMNFLKTLLVLVSALALHASAADVERFNLRGRELQFGSAPDTQMVELPVPITGFFSFVNIIPVCLPNLDPLIKLPFISTAINPIQALGLLFNSDLRVFLGACDDTGFPEGFDLGR